MLKNLLASGFDRRQLLKGAVATSAALGGCAIAPEAATALTQGSAPGSFDPMSRRDNLEAFIKMSGSLDETEDAVGWYGARIFSVIGDFKIIQPLFDVEGFGVSRHEKQPDGSYKRFQRECGFYKDLYSGEIMESWENPLNGKTCKVSHIHNDPVNAHLKEEFPLGFGATEDETVQMMPFLLPWTFMGETAFASFDVNLDWKSPLDPAVWPEASPGERVRVSEYQQWMLPINQLGDTSRSKIYTNGGWQRIANWLPWMRMGQSEGHLFYRSHIKSLKGPEELTPQIRNYAEKHYPEYFEAPKTWITPNESSFEVYAKENEPH
ncbi:MAG: DUF1838 domain-containing protein [Henriciella sp.]